MLFGEEQSDYGTESSRRGMGRVSNLIREPTYQQDAVSQGILGACVTLTQAKNHEDE